MTNFASQLKTLREASGMSQGDLARRVVCQPGHISHFEHGRKFPSLEMLLRLCGALRCTPNDLITADDLPEIRQLPCATCGGNGFVMVHQSHIVDPPPSDAPARVVDQWQRAEAQRLALADLLRLVDKKASEVVFSNPDDAHDLTDALMAARIALAS